MKIPKLTLVNRIIFWIIAMAIFCIVIPFTIRIINKSRLSEPSKYNAMQDQSAKPISAETQEALAKADESVQQEEPPEELKEITLESFFDSGSDPNVLLMTDYKTGRSFLIVSYNGGLVMTER
jgi:hypothetical protein